MLTKIGQPCRTLPANRPQSNLIMVHSAYQPIIGDNINFNINYTNSVTQNNIWRGYKSTLFRVKGTPEYS